MGSPLRMLEKELAITGREARPVIRTPVPGPKSKIIVEEDSFYIATTTKTSPIAAVSGKGSVVLTVDGNVFLDFAAGVGVLNTGYCHPTVVQAVQGQAAQLMHFAGTDFYYAIQAELAKELTQVTPGAAKQKVFFTNSGTESNEAAMKIARWSTKRPQFLAFGRGFHGRTLGSLSLTSSKIVQRERFFPATPGVHLLPFPNPYRNVFGLDGYEDPDALTQAVLRYLEEVLDSQLPPSEAAALFTEAVQGEGGYVFPPKTFFSQLHKILDTHGILLVADEVQTGFGRTGKMFAMEHYGVKPDITTMAKALGSGLPIGAAVFDAKLDFGVPGAHSNTFGGNLVACAAARATLRVIREEKLVERSARLGDRLAKRLTEFQATHPPIGDARGLGLMRAIELVKDRKTKTPDKELRDRIIVEAYRRGLVLLPCGKSTIRLIPPLVLTEEQLEGGCDVLAEAIQAARKA